MSGHIFAINKIKTVIFIVFFLLYFFFAFHNPTSAQQCFDPGPGCNCSQCGPPAYSDPNCQVGGCAQYCPCGSGDWSCCGGGPTPPPKKYSCTQNKCTEVGNDYTGDANCGGNCGIECTITRMDNTKAYSGSSNVYNSDEELKNALQKSNTGQCDGRPGTVNMVRSSSNQSSNPARFRVECNTEEYDESNVLRDWRINQIKFDNTEVYTKLNGIMYSSIAKITELNLPANRIVGKTYIQDFEIWFKDGLKYRHDASGNPIGFEIKVSVTDGLTSPTPPNPSEITSTISQFIDTALPENTRSVEVQTVDKFNVTVNAVDDYLLRNYAYYIAPTAYTDPGAGVYPYISQKRGSQYLGVNQLDSVSPVGNSDFTTLNLTGTVDPTRMFISKVISTKSISRIAQYKLNLSKLVNQVEPFDTSFGDGDDNIANGTFGRWYSEDHYCNAKSGTPNKVSVGSPWLQTKKGNAFIKGPSEINAKSANMSIYNFSTDCKLLAGNSNLPQSALTNCPEGGKANVSSFLFQTTQSNVNAGTAEGDNSRLSRAKIISSEYPHGMTYLSDYFKDSDSSAYKYYLNLIDGIVSGSDLNPTNPINSTCSDPNKSRVTESEGDVEVMGSNGGPSFDILKNINVKNDLEQLTCTDSNGINVIKINGNLTINSLSNPSGALPGSGTLNENTIAGNNPIWPHWYLSTDTIILVSGDVVINPDIRKDLDSNAKSLIIIASGKIEISVGLYKSESKVNKTDYPFYDRIDAFLISDKQIITKNDPQASGKVLDGLKIFGGLVQLGSSKYLELEKCVKPNSPSEIDSSTDSNICLGRDLVLMQNFLAPAETIEYDASVEDTFAPAIGGTNFIYSLREVKTSTGVSTGP